MTPQQGVHNPDEQRGDALEEQFRLAQRALNYGNQSDELAALNQRFADARRGAGLGGDE